MTSAKKERTVRRTGGSSPLKHEVQIQRVYDKTSSASGKRFLVDRLWPRGIQKSALSGVEWLREAAPSAPLRKWFGHEPEKWPEFRKRYRSELEKNPAGWKPLLAALQKGKLILLYGARDPEMNQAVVLKRFLEARSH